MYSFRTSIGPVDLAFTDRVGGVSAAPFDTLNLGYAGADDPAAVEQNLRLVLDDFAPGATLADMAQVHGADVVLVGGARDRAGGERPECDAVVTTHPDVVLMARSADCVPVLLADVDAGVIGAVHSGRPGLLAGVAPAAVRAMQDLGATSIQAWIGPSVCGSCYEVPAAMCDEVAAVVPEARAVSAQGTPALDVAAGVRAQLGALGVTVHDVGRCTREADDLFSYRRDGANAGRLAGVIRMRRSA